jgi:hypothetical protein
VKVADLQLNLLVVRPSGHKMVVRKWKLSGTPNEIAERISQLLGQKGESGLGGA